MAQEKEKMNSNELKTLIAYDTMFNNEKDELKFIDTVDKMIKDKYANYSFNFSVERLSIELSLIYYQNQLASLKQIYEHLKEAWPFLADLDGFKALEKKIWLEYFENSKLIARLIEKAKTERFKVLLYFDDYTNDIYNSLNSEEKERYFSITSEYIDIMGNSNDKSNDFSSESILSEYRISEEKFYQVSPKEKLKKREADLKEKLDAILPNNEPKHYSTNTDGNIYYRYGFDLFGPVILPYIEWLIQQYQEGVFKNIYFFSRDGYLFIKIYDAVCEKLGIEKHSHYLYISKRVTRLLSLREEVRDSFLEDVFVYECIDKRSISSAFNRLGMSAEKYLDVINKYGFEGKDTIIDMSKDKTNLWSLFKDPRVANDLLNIAKEERRLAKAYLEQEEFFDHKQVAIMDLICRGTIHLRLVNFVKEFSDMDIISLNFATTIDAKEKCNKGYKLYGYYATNGLPYQRISILTSMVGLIEAIFTAPHKSVKKYKEENGKIVPEYKSDSVVYFNLTGPIQDGIVDYALSRYENTTELNQVQQAKCEIFSVLRRLYLHPSKQEAKYLGELEVDDFMAITKVASPLPIWKYIFSRKEAMFHYRETPWKRAYLVNLLGTWLTNKKIERFIRKIKG